jgi:hypothetical protein
MTIIKRESAAMGYTHGRLTWIGCQSFQTDVNGIGNGYGQFLLGNMYKCIRRSVPYD